MRLIQRPSTHTVRAQGARPPKPPHRFRVRESLQGDAFRSLASAWVALSRHDCCITPSMVLEASLPHGSVPAPPAVPTSRVSHAPGEGMGHRALTAAGLAPSQRPTALTGPDALPIMARWAVGGRVSWSPEIEGLDHEATAVLGTPDTGQRGYGPSHVAGHCRLRRPPLVGNPPRHLDFGWG